MSIKCPLGGSVIYMDCLECEDKQCKRPRYEHQKQNYVNQFNPETKELAGKYFDDGLKRAKKSKMFNIIKRIESPVKPTNIHMVENSNNSPFSYKVHLYNEPYQSGEYRICYVSGTKQIQVYKSKYITPDCLRLAYYYYHSPFSSFFHGFSKSNGDLQEEIQKEELCKLANKNWTTYGNIIQSETNLELLRLFKIKFIHVMLLDGIIEWCDFEKCYNVKGSCYCCYQCRKFEPFIFNNCNKNRVMIHK